MANNLPALQAKTTHPKEKRVKHQGEMGGQPTSSQETPEGAENIQLQVEEGKEREPKDESGNENEDWRGLEDWNRCSSSDDDSKNKDEGSNGSADFFPRIQRNGHPSCTVGEEDLV